MRVARRGRALLWAALLCARAAHALDFYPEPTLFLDGAGYVLSEVDGEHFRGSGVIGADARLVYTCAHLLFDRGHWATGFGFVAGWHAAREPTSSQLRPLRGMLHYAGYAASTRVPGAGTPRTYALDFALLYGFKALGPTMPVLGATAAQAVASGTRWKMLVGYPRIIDFTDGDGFAYQHITGAFRTAGRRAAANYYVLPHVSTGPGNSGGPLIVFDDDTSDWAIAGVVVSGNAQFAGVKVLEADADALAARARTALTQSVHVYTNRARLALRDNDPRYQERTVKVTDAGKVRELRLSLTIATAFKGDLDVHLVSPAGRIAWVQRHNGGGAGRLELAERNFSPTYAGVKAAGTWRLRMRDMQARDRATFQRLTLAVGTTGG